MSRIPAAFVIPLIIGLTPAAAGAVTVTRTELILSSESCQPALPAFDGNIRKRPLAMQNEGTSVAFLTCAFRGVFGSVRSQTMLGVGLVNNGTSSAAVSCTLVDAGPGFNDPVFITKSINLSGGTAEELAWTQADNGANNYIYPAVSCTLPPETGIRYTSRVFDEEVGM